MIKYRGGKAKELSEMLPFVPNEYDRYIEPFFGGGAMFFHLAPEKAILNDLNKPLMEFYRGVRDDYGRVHEELAQLESLYVANRAVFDERKKEHPNERVEDPNEYLYYSMRGAFNGGETVYSPATVYFFINKTAYSGMIRYNKNGEYNVPYGRYKNFNTSLITPGHSELLKRADLFCGDFADIFKLAKPDDFMFLDPPYDCIFSDYGNEETKDGFGEDEHRRLASAFRSLPCKALLVIGKTDLTEELYGDMIVHEYEKKYAVNIRNRFKSGSTHILVSNY